MQIRLATDADLPALTKLYEERMALLMHSNRRIVSSPVTWLGRDSGAVWVGEAGEVVGGYVSAWWVDGVWTIDHMALHAHVYYPGLARGLVSAVQVQAKAHGAAHILACVPLSHPVEQAFWRALGAARAERSAPAGCEWMQFHV